MNTTIHLSKKLEDKIARIEENFDHAAKDFVLDEIFRCAAFYWAALDENDFCLQSGSGEVLVFGALNRLIWTPARGFQPDRSYCTAKFLANYDAIGPLPGVRKTIT